MDFNDSPEEAAWRAEYRAWLEEHAPSSAACCRTSSTRARRGADYLDAREAWQAMKFDAGFATITWEPEFGGRNGTTMQQIIFSQEEARFAVPTEAFVIGLGMIAPTLQARAAPTRSSSATSPSCCAARRSGASCSASRARVPTSRHSSTTAVRDGDEWVINGQKVWTSGAQYSDFGEIICRTNPDAEKHKGITAFIVDMQRARHDDQAAQADERRRGFNEVFFDDVRVPARERARRRATRAGRSRSPR